MDDALAWLNDCLPDVPMSSTESKLLIGYKSAFLGTLLQVRVSDNSIVVQTDNLSVLAIIKDSLSQSATERNKKVTVQMNEIEYTSVKMVIDTVYPMV